ncbi:MAG: single-stranded DNA-binding protein [Bacteroidetes bacterium]|nr:single-stranded DNA-binding protein [Bacteroidota bacterium]
MKNSVNSVRLIGNAGMNPVVRQFENGGKVANLSLATMEGRKDIQGNWVYNTSWHSLVFRGKQAETVEKLVGKGTKLAIEGKLNHRDYVDKEGQKRYVTEILVNEVLLLGQPKNAGKAETLKEQEVLPF